MTANPRTPHHVGLIMDGNGRWASRRGFPRSAGHAQAWRAVNHVISAALRARVRWLTLFSFSAENWKRDADEVAFLMRPEHWLMSLETAAGFAEQGVTVNVIGDFTDPRLPDEVRCWKEGLEKVTRGAGGQLAVNIAFNYGGRQEILHAVNSLLCASASPVVDARQLAERMWLPSCPDLDLVVRTSGEQRLSNFMIWHAAYAELYFTSTLWPDFTMEHFDEAIREFAGRRRRLGGVHGAAG